MAIISMAIPLKGLKKHLHKNERWAPSDGRGTLFDHDAAVEIFEAIVGPAEDSASSLRT